MDRDKLVKKADDYLAYRGTVRGLVEAMKVKSCQNMEPAKDIDLPKITLERWYIDTASDSEQVSSKIYKKFVNWCQKGKVKSPFCCGYGDMIVIGQYTDRAKRKIRVIASLRSIELVSTLGEKTYVAVVYSSEYTSNRPCKLILKESCYVRVERDRWKSPL